MAMIGALVTMFVGMTIVNRVLEGQFINATDIASLNSVVIFRPMSVFGWFTLPVPNFSFITEGLPKLLNWDYSFFGGNAALIQYLLYSITGFIMFALFIAIIGVVAGRIGRA